MVNLGRAFRESCRDGTGAAARTWFRATAMNANGSKHFALPFTGYRIVLGRMKIHLEGYAGTVAKPYPQQAFAGRLPVALKT